MKKIPAFRAGTHTDMNGKTITFNREDLIATAAAYNPANHEAPIVIGHPETDDPAYGWIDRFEVIDDELVAIPVQVEPVFGEMVDNGRFKKVSMSFYEPNNPNNPKQGVWYPKHLGFLGATPPAIKGLKPIQFSENGGSTFTVNFAETNTNDLLAGLKQFFAMLPLWISTLAKADAQEDAQEQAAYQPLLLPNFSEVTPANSPTKPTINPPVTTEKETVMSADNQPNPTQTPATTTTPTTTTAPAATVVVADPATVAENEALKKRIADMEQAEQKARADAKTAEHVAYAEGLVTAGKLPPAQKDVAVAILAELDNGNQTVSFGEGDNKKPLSGEFKALLDSLPVNAMFGEHATRGNAPQPATVVYSENADPERVLADKQIKDYAKANNVSYAEAAAVVMAG